MTDRSTRLDAGARQVGKRQGPAADGSTARTPLFVFALTCAASVANIYYAQPLLNSMADSFAIDPSAIGFVVTLTQLGYAVGLLAVVPLGDLIDRKKLIVGQTAMSSVALALVGAAPVAPVFLGAMVLVGLLAVVVQVVVAFTAASAAPNERGRAVGLVTSGVVVGILGARFISGALADLGGWRAVYLASAAIMLALSLLLARILPRSPPTTSESYLGILRSIPKSFLRDPLLRSRGILALLAFASFSALWTSMVLPLSAPTRSLTHTEIGLFGFAGLAGALAAAGAGRLADRGFGRWTTGAALALLALSWLPIGLLERSLAVLAVGVVLLDFAVQAVHVTNQSLIFAAFPNGQSRLVGGYMVFYSVGSAIGAGSSTAIYALWGWTGVSVLGAAFGAAGLVVWAVIGRASSASA